MSLMPPVQATATPKPTTTCPRRGRGARRFAHGGKDRYRDRAHKVQVQIPVVVANWILKQGKTLPVKGPSSTKKTSGFIATARTEELDNHWFIEVGDDLRTLLQKGRRLLDACGFHDVQLQVVLKMVLLRTA